MKSTGKPTTITMCIGPTGDTNNVPVGECAVRLARAGNVRFSDQHINHFCLVIVVLAATPQWSNAARE